MKRTTVLKSAAVLGALSLTLAACGGSSETAASSAAPAASSAAPSAAASEAAPAATEACKIGTMLPQTGNLAFLGPPEFAGVDLAVQQINAACGVLNGPALHGSACKTALASRPHASSSEIRAEAEVPLHGKIGRRWRDACMSSCLLMLPPQNI